ncbi:MAG: hypothetical protein ABSG85_16475 [Spirochaetia bacterium]
MQPNRYEIRIRGILSPEWAEWFDGLEIRQEADEVTVLMGSVPDQAALHGLLARVRDLNLTLISVNPSSRSEPAGPRESKGE